MPALCYMQCCFITHTHTNDLLNVLLKCIKFYLYIHIVSRLTVVSREAKKKQHACASLAHATTTVSIYTDGSSKILKCCNSATIAVLLT